MSEIAFPVKDLSRRKTQTALTFLGLTICVAATVFLVVFASNLGFEISFLAKGGRLTSGFYNIFSQFVFTVMAFSILTGPIITSFLVHLNMSERAKDIGIMKTSGCLTKSIFGYFLTELSLLIFASTLAGIIIGVATYYVSTTILNFSGFAIQQALNLEAIAAVSVILVIFSHIAGALPIRKAAQIKPAQAMSPVYNLKTTATLGRNIPAKLGFSFKVAVRGLLRRRTVTTQAIVCLIVVLVLATVSIAGGVVAHQTTINYAERGIGENIVVVGNPAITTQYVSLLSRFFEDTELGQIDYLNQEYRIAETLVNQLELIQGVNKVDPRLILEKDVLEVPGIVSDPLDPTMALVIGGDRSEEALILGVEPKKVVNDWLVFGENLSENEPESALIGDSLAVTMFENAFNQSIRVFDSSPSPYSIGGVCVDPLNNGKVVYLPLETVQRDLNQQGINIVLLQIDYAENPQVLAQIQSEASEHNLTVVELNPIVDKHISFLGEIWSLVMLLPLFSLLTAAISLVSYMMLSVSGQQHEFGVMRALGAKPKNIIKIVLSQAFIILLISGATGIFLGLVITFWFLIPQPVITQNALITLSVGLVVILVFLGASSVYPAFKAVKKSVVEALSEQ